MDMPVQLSSPSRAALTVTLLLTLGMLNQLFLLDTRGAEARDPLVASGEVLYVPDTRVTRAVFLGYDQAAADVIWLRTLEYFAAHFQSDRRYPWLEHFLDQVIALDPAFRRVYHWAGANVLYGRQFTNANVRLSNRFYELALKADPEDYEAAYRLGLNYFVELHSPDHAVQRGYQERGLGYLEMAAAMPGAPPRLTRLVAGISNKLGKSQLALQYLIDLLIQTQDPAQRAGLRSRIESLQAASGGELARAMDHFAASWKSTYPYLPQSVFVLLGEPTTRHTQDAYWRSLVAPSAQGEPLR